MMKKHLLTAITALLIGSAAARAQFVIDTAQSEQPIGVGLRAGVNVSNVSTNEKSLMPSIFDRSSHWRAGFTGGAVIDLRIRNFLALQPGFLFETRSASYMRTSISPADLMTATMGQWNYTTIQFPVLLSFRMQYGSDYEVQLDFGPYFSHGLGGSEKYTVTEFDGDGEPDSATYKGPFYGADRGGMANRFDWGFKMGAGLQVARHFYLGVHYLAGCRNILTPDASSDPNADDMMRAGACGRSRAWEFTLGYNF